MAYWHFMTSWIIVNLGSGNGLKERKGERKIDWLIDWIGFEFGFWKISNKRGQIICLIPLAKKESNSFC